MRCFRMIWCSWRTIYVITSLTFILTDLNDASPRFRRSHLDELETYKLVEPEGPGTYAFGFDIDDYLSENVQFRHEERHANGTVRGEYGFVTPEGSIHIVNYIADRLGYRATSKTVPRGFGKPIRVNVEEDIADAIVAAKRLTTNRVEALGNDWLQSSKTLT